MMMYRQPAIFQAFEGVLAAESMRHGGVSPAPYHSLNLGINTHDTPDHVATNRALFLTSLGITENQLATSFQVHGEEIAIVSSGGRSEGFDALITDSPNVFVGVTVADCTPILIFDSARRVAAAVHAGWKGTAARLVSKTLQTMQQTFGSKPADCYAYIGTCIDECAFEVGEEVAARFSDSFKRFDVNIGKYFIDLKRANAAQILDFGLPATQIEISPFSTVLHNDDYFSHRANQGQTGRMMALIGFR
ncbi:MAG: peptidoglycan editing factor PgeF [Runella sp.]